MNLTARDNSVVLGMKLPLRQGSDLNTIKAAFGSQYNNSQKVCP